LCKLFSHALLSGIEVAYQEAVALKRQEELIREEELLENEMKGKRVDKRGKKKQVSFLLQFCASLILYVLLCVQLHVVGTWENCELMRSFLLLWFAGIAF
jgi:uncharacterized protein YxeA